MEAYPSQIIQFFNGSGAAGRRWPSNEEFMQAFLTYKAYSVPRRCKLLLEELEKSHGHKEPVILETATIEHVLPQTLTDEWRLMLGGRNEADSLHEQWSNTIGNLTLTAYNPELSNLAFDQKKLIYANSHYSLNAWFENCPVWTEREILERATVLWNIAKDVWPSPVQAA